MYGGNQPSGINGNHTTIKDQLGQMFEPVDYGAYMYSNSPPNVEKLTNPYPNYAPSKDWNPMGRSQQYQDFQPNYSSHQSKSAPKVFIYARRSSTKNKETSISIEKQVEILLNLAGKYGFEVVNVFKDNKSGFVADNRDEFSKMLAEIETRNVEGKQENHYIDYILIYTASRLSRNSQEAYRIANLVENEHLRIIAIDKQYSDTNAGKESLIHDLNKEIFFSKKLSVEGKINMDRTYMKKIRFPRMPPYGYRIDGRKENSRIVTDDYNQASELVVKIFEYYGTGEHSFLSISKKLNGEGYKMYKVIKGEFVTRPIEWKDIANILKKEIYYGKIVVEYKNLKREEIAYFEGVYEGLEIVGNSVVIDYTEVFKTSPTFKPLISRDLYLQCKNIRTGKHTGGKHTVDLSEGAIFKGILKCTCNHTLEEIISKEVKMKDLISYTADIKKKKSGNIYYYWRCSHGAMKHICPHSSNITQTDLLSIIQENVFSRLYLNTDIRKDVEAYIRVFTENIIVKQLDNVQDATRRLKSITEEKRKLLLKFLDVNNSSPIQKVISDEIEKKTKEEEKLNTYIKKLKQNQAFEYTEVAEGKKLKKDQSFYVPKDDGEMGQMYKNSEEEFIDEETTIKHLEKIELKRREKFVNEKVKEWSDFLFHVEDMIQNFSSFPVQKQSEIMQFIFDGIVLKNGEIQLFKISDVFLFLITLLSNSSIDYVGGYVKNDDFSRTFGNLRDSIKEPLLAPLLVFMSNGSPEAVGLELIINSITKYSFLELKELYLMDE